MTEHSPKASDISARAGVENNNHDDSAYANEKAGGAQHLEDLHGETSSDDSTTDLHKRAGLAVIQQQHTIPVTGDRLPTTKWEYIFFCIFCEFGVDVAGFGGFD